VRRRDRLAVGVAIGALVAAISGAGLIGLAAFSIAVATVVWFQVSPGLLVSLALAATVFSTHTQDMGLPIQPERVLLAAGLASLAVGLPFSFSRQRLPQLRWRAVHSWMLLAIAVALISMLATKATVPDGSFILLDDYGIIPFVLFALAPALYPNERERSRLVAVLVVVGWYLAITAFLEGIGLKHLTWPAYINNPSIGAHFDRARGPFVEATINGLGLLGGVTAGIIGVQLWRSRAAKWVAGALIPFGLLGCVFTLTRGVWIAAAAFTLVAILGNPRTRRFFVPVVLAALAALLLAFTLVPGLTQKADTRASDQQPVWDRLNNNRAAIVAFEHHPFTGLGWQRTVGNPYLWQADTYPLTGATVVVHNVFLSNLAQLGLVGFVPWCAALVLGVLLPALRRAPPPLLPFRAGLQAFLVAWLGIAMFAPLAGPFPNYLLFLLAGIVSAPQTSFPPRIAPVQVVSAGG